MKKVSAIVCAFNEEGTLENVLRSVSESPLISRGALTLVLTR